MSGEGKWSALVSLATICAIVTMLVFVLLFFSPFAGILMLAVVVLVSFLLIPYPRLVRKKLGTYFNDGQPLLFLSGGTDKIEKYGFSWQIPLALFYMGKWEEALVALEEEFRRPPNVNTPPYDAYLYHYNKAVFLLYTGDFSASQEAYDEFQKQVELFPKDQAHADFIKNYINVIDEHYRLRRAYMQEQSQESLRDYLDFFPKFSKLPNSPTRLNEIILHYYEGLYELRYRSAQRAAAHFDFVLGTGTSTWYGEAARTERAKIS